MNRFVKHKSVLYAVVAVLIFSMQMLFMNFNFIDSARNSGSARSKELVEIGHHKVQAKASQNSSCQHLEADHGQNICLDSDNCCHCMSMITNTMRWVGATRDVNTTDVKLSNYHIFLPPQIRPPQLQFV